MYDIIEALKVSNIRDVLQTIAFLFLFQYYLRSDSFHVEIITFHSVPVFCLFLCFFYFFYVQWIFTYLLHSILDFRI